MPHPRSPFLLGAAILLLAVSLAAVATAAAKTAPPRFALTINGTQRFEWDIDGGLDSITGSAACAFRAHGAQVLEFSMKAPLTVVPTDISGPSGAPGGKEFRAIVAGKQRRLLPLIGKETRDYQVLEGPQTGSCPAFGNLAERHYDQSCQATNQFKSGAGVVLIRNGQRLEMHTPVDVMLYERRPATCDIRIFDLRNTIISQLISWAGFLPVHGGNLTRMSGRVLTAKGHLVYCVNESDSDETGVSLRDCDKPEPAPRGTKVTGRITHDWTITLRRL